MILKKLRIRFIVINMLLVSLVLIGIFLANTISTAQKVASNSYSYLNDDARRIGILSHGESVPRKDTPPSIFPHDIIWLKTDSNDYEIQNKMTAPSYSDEYIDAIIDAALDTDKNKGLLKSYDLRYIVYKTPGNETIIGFIDVSYEQSFIYDQIFSYLLIGIASLAVFFIISFFLSKVVIKPVYKAFKLQQQFISDASHELKTPITVILANASIILNKKNGVDTKEWVGYIDKEAKRMKKLVEDLLFLARLDEDDKAILTSKFNLGDAMYECILPFEPVAFESGVKIHNEITSDVFIKGNINQIKRLVLILLDNACKYSPMGEVINIKLNVVNGKANISVHNTGAPIPFEDAEKIFDRFYRVDKARERNSNSYGLGLSMAKKIVESHKGEITVSSDEKSGTTFNIILPIISMQYKKPIDK